MTLLGSDKNILKQKKKKLYSVAQYMTPIQTEYQEQGRMATALCCACLLCILWLKIQHPLLKPPEASSQTKNHPGQKTGRTAPLSWALSWGSKGVRTMMTGCKAYRLIPSTR